MTTLYLKTMNKRLYYILFLLVFTCCVLYSDDKIFASDSIKEITTLEQLENIRVGVFGVSSNKELIENKNPKITNFLFYNTLSDAIAALKANKVDCFAADVPVLQLFANRNPDLDCNRHGNG